MRIKGFLLLLFIGLGLIGCAAEEESYEEINRQVIQLLTAGEFEEAHTHLCPKLGGCLSAEGLESSWRSQTKDAGDFIASQEVNTSYETSSFTAVESELEFSQMILQSRFVFNEKKEIVSTHFKKAYANLQLAPGIVEEDMVIGEGSDYELGGTLTLPQEQDMLFPAVVLVHGSGPSDRDERAYAYKPFRDIAWGIAEHGIATLRYDKRSYTHGKMLVAEFGNELTVKEETIEDAIKAANLLKEDPRIDSEQVYIIGHSLGGMLAPRIDKEGGDFAGLVILAGSLRPLWEIVYDQNMALLNSDQVRADVREVSNRVLEKEMEKAVNLANFTKEEAVSEVVFDIPAYYLQEMDLFPTMETVAQLEKPILVLQGEDDFQVTLENDYRVWEDLLQEKDNATLKTYEGLNHFFISYEGKDEGTVGEYEHPKLVDEQVINHMAEWIKKHSE